MFTIFFGEMVSGRLGRPDYLRYSLLLLIIGGNAVVATHGLLVELGIRQGLGQLGTLVETEFGSVGIATLWAFVLAFLAACLNLFAKRARDAGLSGSLVVLLLVLAGRALVGLGLAGAIALLLLAAWLALMAVPTGRFGSRQRAG